MGKRLKIVPMLVLALGGAAILGCGGSDPSAVPSAAATPRTSSFALNNSDSVSSEAPLANGMALDNQVSSIEDPPANSVDASAGLSQDTSGATTEADVDAGERTPTNRPTALGQMGMGGMGGGMGGMGGGMGGMGGMGGGGMGGMGGMGGGGGGGVSINPSIKWKKDGTGKLDLRRRDATNEPPRRGSFSSDSK